MANSTDAAALSRLLYLLATAEEIPQEQIVKPTFERLVQPANTLLKHSLEETMTPPQYHREGLGKSRWEELLAVVECYMRLGLTHEGAQLFSLSLPIVPDRNCDLWKNWRFSIEYLKNFVEFLTRHVHTELPSRAIPFIASLLHTMAGHFATTRPPKPATWYQGSYRRSGNNWGKSSCECPP
jgi:hypothetical protein